MSIAGGRTRPSIIRSIGRVLHYCPRTGVSRSRASRVAPVRISRCRRRDAHTCTCTCARDGDRRIRAIRLCLVAMGRRAELIVTTSTRTRAALAVTWRRGSSRLLWRMTLICVVAILRIHRCGSAVRWGRCVGSLSISTTSRGRRWHMGTGAGISTSGVVVSDRCGSLVSAGRRRRRG